MHLSPSSLRIIWSSFLLFPAWVIFLSVLGGCQSKCVPSGQAEYPAVVLRFFNISNNKSANHDSAFSFLESGYKLQSPDSTHQLSLHLDARYNKATFVLKSHSSAPDTFVVTYNPTLLYSDKLCRPQFIAQDIQLQHTTYLKYKLIDPSNSNMPVYNVYY